MPIRDRKRRADPPSGKSTRRVFLLPDFTLAISMARFRALFAALGAPANVSARATHATIARALFGGDIPTLLADALEEIARLACEDGRRALVEAALSLGVDTRAWPLHEGVADLAAYVVLYARTNDAAAKVVRRAHVRLNRLLSPNLSYELAAAFDATERDCAARLAKRFLRALADDVWAVADEEGRLHLAVLYRAAGEAAVVDGERVVTRPLRADWIRVDFDARRIFVVTATPERLHAYGAVVGETAWGDARAFGERPSITFKPIQERRAGALDAITLPPGVRKVTVTAWQLDAGDGSRHEVRANDALPALETHLHVAGGYFSRLNVRVDIDAAPHPVDVVMQLPNIVRYSDLRWAAQARAAADALGLFAPGQLPDDARTLAPYVHPEWRWVSVLGAAAVGAMVRESLLRPVKTSKLASKEHGALARSVTVHVVPGEPGARYALAEDRSTPARNVRDDDAVMLALALDDLAERHRAALGLARVAKEKEVAGFLDIGELVHADGIARIAYAMTTPRRGALEALRKSCGMRAVPIVLVPAGRRFAGEGVAQIELGLAEQFGAGDLARVASAVREEAGIEAVDEVGPATRRARSAEMVAEKATGRIWLFGDEMLDLPEGGQKFLMFLAERGRRGASAADAGGAVSPGSLNPDVVGRKMRRNVDRWIAKTYRRLGKPVPAKIAGGIVVREGTSGYRLVVTAIVV
jgi:hypothetical protein